MEVVDPDSTIVTDDSGSPRYQICPTYRAGGPRSYIGWGKSHQLGTGLGLIMGAKLAAPDKFCVNEARHMKTSHDLFKNRDLGCNYSDMAKAMCGWSERVTNPGEIKNAKVRARKATDSGRAALLEFVAAAERTVSHLHELCSNDIPDALN